LDAALWFLVFARVLARSATLSERANVVHDGGWYVATGVEVDDAPFFHTKSAWRMVRRWRNLDIATLNDYNSAD